MRLMLECVSIACPTCTIVDETPVRLPMLRRTSFQPWTPDCQAFLCVEAHVPNGFVQVPSHSHSTHRSPALPNPHNRHTSSAPGSPTQPHHDITINTTPPTNRHHGHGPPVQPSHDCSNTASFSLFRGSCPPATSRCHPWLPPQLEMPSTHRQARSLRRSHTGA